MEHHFSTAAEAISWLFQLIALPFYSGRMTGYRLMSSLSVFAQDEMIKAQVTAYRNFISNAKRAEEELAQGFVDLHTDAARKAAAEMFEASVGRMKQEFVKDLPMPGGS